MTRDEIIKLAREAGAEIASSINYDYGAKVAVFYLDDLARFAALIEQHLIESGYRKCAEGQRMSQHCGLLEAAVSAEREACAKVAEKMLRHYTQAVTGVPEAIRARGQA